jgi:hypothetical protein
VRIAAIYMTTGSGHVVFVEASAIWSIFPRPEGCRIYLHEMMDPILKPSDAARRMPADEGVMALMRAKAMGRVGTIVDANATVAEAAVVAGLPLLTLRMEPEGMKVALSPAWVVSVAPALDQNGAAVGSNIFTRGTFLETDSSVIQVIEQVPDVLAAMEWHGKVVQIGSPFVAKPMAANDPALINTLTRDGPTGKPN